MFLSFHLYSSDKLDDPQMKINNSKVEYEIINGFLVVDSFKSSRTVSQMKALDRLRSFRTVTHCLQSHHKYFHEKSHHNLFNSRLSRGVTVHALLIALLGHAAVSSDISDHCLTSLRRISECLLTCEFHFRTRAFVVIAYVLDIWALVQRWRHFPRAFVVVVNSASIRWGYTGRHVLGNFPPI